MCSSSPDMTAMNTAATASADLGKEALSWYKQVYNDGAGDREAASNLARDVSGAQLDGMRTATRIANDADTYNRQTFRPLEREVVADAKNFDTEAKRNELAGLAGTDVQLAAANARDQTQRAMTRMGVNPNDGAYGANAGAMQSATTLALADAKTKARRDAMTLGDAKKMDAISLGRGLPGQQATQSSIALNSGNSAVGNAQVPLAVAGQGAAQVGQGFSTALQGNSSAGNLYGQAAQIGSKDDGMLGGLANLAMAGKYIFSDKKIKTGRKPVKGDVALAAARKMPIDTWRYKRGSAADDGGKKHIGPMAQDVHKALGDKAAPGGELLDESATGSLALAAVQEVDRGQKRLEKVVISLANAVRKDAAKDRRAA